MQFERATSRKSHKRTGNKSTLPDKTVNTKDEKVDDCGMVGMAGRICTEVQFFLGEANANLVPSISESALHNYKKHAHGLSLTQ